MDYKKKPKANGFTLLINVVLVAIPVVAVQAGSARALQMNKHMSKINLAREGKSLADRTRILYRSKSNCTANLNDKGLGTVLKDLEKRSASGKIQLSIPSASATDPAALFLAKKKNSGNITVIGMNFSPPQLIHPTDTFYKSVLRIEIQSHGLVTNGESRFVEIPFYFGTDSAARLTECFATTAMDAENSVEDLLCSKTFGPGFKYLPGRQRCELVDVIDQRQVGVRTTHQKVSK